MQSAAMRRGTIAYGAIENTGDRQLEDAIRSWLRCEPDEVTFISMRVSIDQLRGNFTEEPELFLSDGDQDGHDTVIELAEAYGRNEVIPPIVVARDQGGFAVLDGCHRLSGAFVAGETEIDVYLADRPVVI